VYDRFCIMERERMTDVAKISNLLGTCVRVTISDGRAFTGIFKVRF